MRAALMIALLAGCGFTAGGGQSGPGDDSAVHDAGPVGEGSVQPADGPIDSAIDGAIDGAPSDCPIGYAVIGSSGSEYRYSTTPLTWSTAEADCEGDTAIAMSGKSTHLVVLDDATERGLLIQNHANLWIGATDTADEGVVKWVTAQLQPYDLSGASANADNKDCVRVKNPGTDEYRDCLEPNPFVCECDRYAPDSRNR